MHVLEAKELVREDAIRDLVERFYAVVRDDPLLGPVFGRQIAADAWPAHLDRMCAFWSTALRATGRYRGDPMRAHVALDDVRPEHFDRWLELFGETAATVFAPPVAEAILGRARRMGVRLLRAIEDARRAG